VREWFAGKELGGLVVREGLLPALPGLKRKAQEDAGEELQAAVSGHGARGRCRSGGAGPGSPEPVARSGGKAASKPKPTWRVKAPVEEPSAPATEAAPAARRATEPPAPEERLGPGKRAKVWRVKAVDAAPAEGAEATKRTEGAEGLEDQDRSMGFWESCIQWLGGLCICRC